MINKLLYTYLASSWLPGAGYIERRKITNTLGDLANSAQGAPLVQLSARLHGHIYHPRSCTRRRLDLIRS